MTPTGNGSVRLVYWLLTGLLGLVTLLGSLGLVATQDSIKDLRLDLRVKEHEIDELRLWSVRFEQHLCRVESKVDDVRERQGQKVFRTPCP